MPEPSAGGDQDDVHPGTVAPAKSTDANSPTLFRSLPSLSRVMSVVMLVLGILGVGLLFYKVMAGFFVPLFLAALLVVIFRPLHEWLLARTGNRRRVAAALTTATILFIVLLPVLFLLSVAAGQFARQIKQFDSGDLRNAFKRSREQLGLALPSPEYFRRLDEILEELKTAQASKLDPEVANQAVSIIGSLGDTEELQSVAKPDVSLHSDEAIAALTKLSGDLEAWQNSGVNSDRLSLDDLDRQEELSVDAESAASLTQAWVNSLLGGSFRAPLKLAANLSDNDIESMIGSASEFLQPRFVQLTSRTGGFLLTLAISTVIMIISVYFFLIDGPGMIRTLMRLSPLDDLYERRLLLEFDRTSRAVVLASVLSAIAQGFLAAIGFQFFGFSSVVLLFFVTSVMALVPFLGAASVWLPCAIWLGAVEREWWSAIALTVYGALIVSSIDNVIKVFVLHGRSQLHPLLALLSVLGGVTVFGPIGILVGPMIVVFLQTLLEILNHELAAETT